MGQFSWIYSDTNRQVVDCKDADTYLLVPEPFQDKYGKAIYEDCYDGYGHFGKYDIFDLVAEWNKDMIPEIIRRIDNGTWHSSFQVCDKDNMLKYYNNEKYDCKLRNIGIIMSGYDEDNFALEYPIKITTTEMDYKKTAASLSDPNQGWERYESWDDENECYFIHEEYDNETDDMF